MKTTNELDSFEGVSDKEMTYRFSEAIRIANEISLIKGNPIARYDAEKQQAYFEFPDGRIEYVEA